MPHPAAAWSAAPTAAADHGQLAANVMRFARLLRRSGLPVGTDRVQAALQALTVAGLERQDDFHAVLSACLLDRIEHRTVFDQAYALFWRDSNLLGQLAALLAPPTAQARPAAAELASRRVSQALLGVARPPAPDGREPDDDSRPGDAALSFSARERLQAADFDGMSADEWAQAKRLLQQLRLLAQALPTRRTQAAACPGRADWRATLRASARNGGDLVQLRWRQRRERPAPLVLLADISGSMSRYSRMLLHFAHGLGLAQRQGGARVESFVFGTRLTRSTRQLASRDPDLAVGEVVRAVQDWSGGTRISACLHQFNQRWARRVLDSRSTVLLVTDGLEHGDTAALSFEMERLHKSCRRLVWLNPLLRFKAFEPRAAGIQAMLPHVDRFVPAHNLQSLADLVQLLASPDTPNPVARRPRAAA